MFQQETVQTTSGVPAMAKKNQVATIEELTKQMQSLSLMLMSLKEGSGAPLQQPAQAPRRNQGSDQDPSMACCFMCGQIATHPLGPRFCPETNGLLNKHLMTFDALHGRYVLTNGQDLPRVPPGWVGGVSSYL